MEDLNKKQQARFCFIYARVSTVRQAKEGYSIGAQIKHCKDFAKRLGYKVKEVFADRGESGTALDRPQFQEMLNRCEDGEVDAVIVFHLDRFARNEYDFFLIKRNFEKLGIKILSVSQPNLSGDTPESHLVQGILASVDAYFSRDNSRKTKKGMRRKFEEGWYPSWAPLGYKNVKDEISGRNVIAVDEYTAPLIRKAFELYATGNYSLRALKDELSKLGLRGRKGNKLSESSLQRILTNPFYYGLMRWSGMEKMGKHKPLISKKLFDRVQYVLASHRDFLIRERKYNFLLRGIVWCEVHNRRLVAEWHNIKSSKRKRIGYYHCTHRGGCKGSYIEIETLEEKVADLLKNIQFKKEFIELVVSKAKEYLEDLSKTIVSRKRSLQNKIEALEVKRDNLENLLIEGKITPEIFNRLHSKIESEINSLYHQIIDVEKERSIDIDFLERILAFTRDIYKTYKEAPNYLKRRYLRLFIEKVYIKDKDISQVNYREFFKTLIEEQKVILRNNWLRGQDSNLQPAG